MNFETNQNAAEIMESLLIKGIYGELKQAEKNLKAIKSAMHHQLHDSEAKRHEFEKVNVVAKFVPKKIYDVDYKGIVEHLFNYLHPEIACRAIKIDVKSLKDKPEILDELELYKRTPTYYVKPSLNKSGKGLTGTPELDFESLNIHQLAKEFTILNPTYKQLEEVYENSKAQMLQCPELNEKKKLSHQYGSVSLVQNQAEYRIFKLLEDFGEDFLIEHCVPNSSKVQWFIDNRLLSKSDIDAFKTIKDIRLDFIVMPLDVEREILTMQSQRRLDLSLRNLG
ncbi:hypothetical protein HPT25_26360 [Bacillus sp. BRMEA1]|uniref:hypothetical protein n=1 Tax=Neobacillus endophyticus TaxID=2738405 RepID=UPI00156755A7|nr:hypothetical protein [Neobacillus endophyticus]NRD80855.1 hypothetical protein [Neobacillus endophyticus]